MNDNFTTAATAEARRESPLYDNEVLSYGVRMAAWARDHLAAQEPTDADTDALTERLWEAIAEARDKGERTARDVDSYEVVAAVLPIVAVEVRKAKAEALREAGRGLERGWPNKLGIDLPPEDYDHAGDHAIDTAHEYLKQRAVEHETRRQR